jgi:phage terminase large subunit GpA-like protein
VFAIKGVGGDGRPLVGRPSKNNIGKVNLFPIGVDTAKHLLFSRFRITEPGAGYCHFPTDRDDEYFKQLTAEKIATRYHKGFAKREFVKVRARNEALDVRVYAMAALTLLNANLKALHNRMMANLDKSEQVKKVAPQMKKTQRGGAFVNRWR